MAATSWRKRSMEELLDRLHGAFPALTYRRGDAFYWSPAGQYISYNPAATGQKATWSLLHETAHALLGHRSYRSDFELISLEVAAWERTRQLAHDLGIVIADDHIQDCLDTYRNWLDARSICPRCTTRSVQEADGAHYRCFNCHKIWHVTPSRFRRTYRAAAQRGLQLDRVFDAAEVLA